jgi:uncharacterized protein YbcI
MAHHVEAQHDGAARAAVSNMMIRVHIEHAGRGPVKARTYMSDDMVACVLEDGLTPIERTLATDGRSETVEHIRHLLQEAMRRDMVSGVEEISGRRVRAFLSANQVDPNIAVETFLLEAPTRRDGPVADEANAEPGAGTASAREHQTDAPEVDKVGDVGTGPRPEPSYRAFMAVHLNDGELDGQGKGVRTLPSPDPNPESRRAGEPSRTSLDGV